MENQTGFKYLVRVLTAGYYDWLAVVGTLGKSRNIWGRLSRILRRKGADPKVSGHFFKRCRRLCCYLGRIRGCLPLGCSGPWIASIRGLRNGSPGGIQGDGEVGVWPTQRWRRQWGKQASRGSGNTSRGGRTRSRSIFRGNQFCTSVRVPLGGQERGCLGIGGNSPA